MLFRNARLAVCYIIEEASAAPQKTQICCHQHILIRVLGRRMQAHLTAFFWRSGCVTTLVEHRSEAGQRMMDE